MMLRRRMCRGIDSRRCIACFASLVDFAFEDGILAVFCSRVSTNSIHRKLVKLEFNLDDWLWRYPEHAFCDAEMLPTEDHVYFIHTLCFELMRKSKHDLSLGELMSLGSVTDRTPTWRTEASTRHRSHKAGWISFTTPTPEVAKLLPFPSRFTDFPAELLNLIVQQATPSLLVSVAITCSLTNPMIDMLRTCPLKNLSYPLDCSAPIYVSSKQLFEETYITHLSNTPLNDGDQPSICNRNISRIVLNVDDIGVRNITFRTDLDESYLLTATFGRRFRSIAHSILPYLRIVQVKTSLMVQNITVTHGIGAIDWNIDPPPALRQNNCFPFDCEPRLTVGQRLNYVSCRTSLAGLSVSCARGTTYTIHAYQRNSEVCINECYSPRYQGEDAVWMYIPMQAGDTISNVFIRTMTDHQPCVIITTSFGKIHVLGPHIDGHNEKLDVRIRSLRGNANGLIRGLILDANGIGSPSKGLKIAIDIENKSSAQEHLEHDLTPLLIWPLNPIPRMDGAPNFDWYFSKADLLNVEFAQLCTESCGRRHRCLGIWFRTNESDELLGQWDFTKEIGPIIAYPKYIRYHEDTSPDYPRIFDVSFGDSGKENITCEEEDHATIQLLTGRVEWWFGRRGELIAWDETAVLDAA